VPYFKGRGGKEGRTREWREGVKDGGKGWGGTKEGRGREMMPPPVEISGYATGQTTATFRS